MQSTADFVFLFNLSLSLLEILMWMQVNEQDLLAYPKLA